jgi:hypothetical protein
MLLAVLAVAGRSMVKPAAFLEYPTVVGLLMMGWFLPQAWSIERQGPPWIYEPASAWIYVFICMAAIVAGFRVGQRLEGSTSIETDDSLNASDRDGRNYCFRRCILLFDDP